MEKELNLIQQLQQTPKWKEFSRWFVEKNYPCTTLKDDHVTGCHEWFVQLHPDFQKGVFEKFISKDNLNITIDGYLGNETYGIGSSFTEWNWFENFEQLLIWYFNN